MPDDLYEVFGDTLHEIAEIEEPLRAWLERKPLEALAGRRGSGE